MDQERFERLTPDQRDLVRRSGALERVVEPYETETTTTYQCWLDEDIDDHDFVLDLPDP